MFRNRWGEQTKTALGDRNQVEEHISPAPATDGAQGTSGGSFVIPGITIIMNIIMLLPVCPLPHYSKEAAIEDTISKVILLKMVEQMQTCNDPSGEGSV